MTKLLLFGLLAYLAYKFFVGRTAAKEEISQKPEPEETHRDPVCGVYVSKADAVIGRVEDERIYFCSMACLEKYRDQLENK